MIQELIFGWFLRPTAEKGIKSSIARAVRLKAKYIMLSPVQ